MLAASVTRPTNMRINDKNINRQIGASWIGRCDAREFILFFLPPHKEKETQPTKQHIPQKRTSQRFNQFFAGRAVFLPTHLVIILMMVYKNERVIPIKISFE